MNGYFFNFRLFVYYKSVFWIEYWIFFGCYVDLVSFQGLKKFEDYLVERKERIVLSRLLVIFQRVRTVKNVSRELKILELR